jgi:hypothetical protein
LARQRPDQGRLLGMLCNPAYAGIYAYGRSRVDPERRRADRPCTGRVRVDRADWTVFLPGVGPIGEGLGEAVVSIVVSPPSSPPRLLHRGWPGRRPGAGRDVTWTPAGCVRVGSSVVAVPVVLPVVRSVVAGVAVVAMVAVTAMVAVPAMVAVVAVIAMVAVVAAVAVLAVGVVAVVTGTAGATVVTSMGAVVTAVVSARRSAGRGCGCGCGCGCRCRCGRRPGRRAIRRRRSWCGGT